MESIPLCHRNKLEHQTISQHNFILFYQKYTTCFGSLGPPSGVYRLEIYRQMHLIL